ncbi:winged helix-turn-helix transcriptional regulator [Aureimonas leprariae]|uniref:Helix-turn-helix transcriptional regulator n=1 Tax=Plantimonas leprariae TaxID=2615207 RepID=A0A7V7TXR9_9HYPH|nr:helix-turn-helix domain-containing protein [Aureimonas leprariae]KAB0681291.1 helix-turn-helix transcriptional regulator [Aureimonas leprariae]
MSTINTVPPIADRLRRGDVFEPECRSRQVMRHVTSSWGVLILIALQDGTMRFSTLRRRVSGVSERMLAQTLRWLEEDRLVVRRSYDVVPPHTDYTLTALGREAAEKVAALADWIETRMPEIDAGR